MQCLGLDAIDAFLDQALVICLGRDEAGMNMFVLIFLGIMKADCPLSECGQFGDLREAVPSISGDDGSILAYAKAVPCIPRLQFCSVCGSPAASSQAGHTRSCGNTDCAATHFPRTNSSYCRHYL